MDPLTTVVVSAGVGAVSGLLAEFIKARWSSAYWVGQERWKLKRDNYTALVTALTKLRWLTAELKAITPKEEKAWRVATEEQLPALHGEVAIQKEIAQLWLSAEAQKALEEMVQGFVAAIPKGPEPQAFWEHHLEAMAKASRLLQEAARRELMAV